MSAITLKKMDTLNQVPQEKNNAYSLKQVREVLQVNRERIYLLPKELACCTLATD